MRPGKPVVEVEIEPEDGVPAALDRLEDGGNSCHVGGVVGGPGEDDVLGDFLSIDLAGMDELHEGGLHGMGGLADVVDEGDGEGIGLDEGAETVEREELGGGWAAPSARRSRSPPPPPRSRRPVPRLKR